ncbi:class I SAM-dependent methyltransferase [Schleiferilactobacillus shenzhenensis]|nr:class I SAM-dependent methyltransferase [Schleiferilactobacillus shenzhenensis]
MTRTDDQETAAAWDDFAPEYYAMQQADPLPLAQRMGDWLQAEKILPAGRVLDLGSGAGRFAPMLARGAMHLTLMDISSQMLAYAQKELARAGQTAETISAPWSTFAHQSGVYDVIFSHMATFLTPADLSIIGALLAPGGIFVYSRVTGRTDSIFDQVLAAFPPLRQHYVDESRTPISLWQEKSRQAQWTQRQTLLTFHYTEPIDRDYLAEEIPPLLAASDQAAFGQLLKRLFGGQETITTTKSLAVTVLALTAPAGHRRS